MTRFALLFPICLGAIGSFGCASGLASSRPTVQLTAQTRAAPPARLTESVFHKPAERINLSEAAIARVLDAPVLTEFPARAGVVVLSRPFSRSAYACLEPGDEAPQRLARELGQSSHFALVSDVSPHLADGQHVESLRELATRYRLKYLVVFNRTFVDRSHLNSWGWGWATLVGIPFVPAYTLRTVGILEATLMDVRTGTFLFTSQIHVKARRDTTPFGTKQKLTDLRRSASRRAAKTLAKQFLQQCNRVVAAAKTAQQNLAGIQEKNLIKSIN